MKELDFWLTLTLCGLPLHLLFVQFDLLIKSLAMCKCFYEANEILIKNKRN